ncbi:TolC family protein [Bdellovibrionota bacterium FG-1]
MISTLKTQAMEKSPDIRQAQTTMSAKQAQLYTSWARWAPRVDLQVSGTQQQNYSFLTSLQASGITGFPISGGVPVTSLYSWQLGFTLPIYKRSVHLSILQSLAERSLAEAQLESKINELDWHLRQLLGDFLVKTYQLATLRGSLEQGQSNLKDAKLRFQLGQNTRVDVLRAEANLVSLESKRLTFEQQRKTSLSAFLEYSGFTLEEFKLSAIESFLKDEAETLTFIEQFTETESLRQKLTQYEDPARKLVESGPNYRAYLDQEDLANAQARQVMLAEWPELDLQGNLNKQSASNNAFSDLSNLSQNVSYALGFTVTIPIFSWGTTVSTLTQISKTAQVNEIQRQRDTLKLKNEVENDQLRVEALTRSVESLKINVAQNEEIVRLSQKSYTLGKATLVELLGSQNDLITSKINLAQNRVDLSVTVRKLAWNLGVHGD